MWVKMMAMIAVVADVVGLLNAALCFLDVGAKVELS